MNKLVNTMFLATILFFVTCGFSSATTIIDEYWGGTPGYGNNGADTNPKDIVGNDVDYDVSKIEVTQAGDTINLKIYSRFLDDSRELHNNLVQLGDLFISTDGWDPVSTSSNYTNDTASAAGEDWEYALVLDNHIGTTSGTTSLYNIEDGTILLSDYYFDSTNYEYRKDQEVRFDANGAAIDTSPWSINFGTTDADTDDYLSLAFSLADLGFSFGQELGFHWTMTCANDVIEGAFKPVPEPATMLLFGTGLIGLAGLTARRRNKK